ncbi:MULTISPECIES: NAD(P)H-dependent oxidoreductase [unclassified Mesorhizobium]|uniref:NAD(P)H-dependent oxidoreductase n=1 Tax=unclassified Mesorhizobium TaxID=325217 RepID=UPI001678CA8E|nr:MULTISPECIES: NAD(P)H-dependent oxidoreductase [unclassified Mesorhizobium]
MGTIVGISGNFSRPSKTRRMVETIVDAAARELNWGSQVFDLVDAGPSLGATFGRKNAPPEIDRIWMAIETCDALVVGSPVYKASYTGLLKHLFDVLDMNALRERPVLVAATAKAPSHELMIDHQFRPLFAFFRAVVVPGSVYALDHDFGPENEPTEGLRQRIAAAVGTLVAAVR